MAAKKELMFYILVPIYKAEKYIRKCIESVLGQSYHCFKLILVDDGSPDNAGRICDEFAYMDGRIKVIHQKNMGALAARETAISFIRSAYPLENAYVMFLDSDDSLKQNALQRLADVICLEDCDMVIYGMDRVSNGRVVIPYDKGGVESYLEKDKRLLYKKVFFNSFYNPVCRKAIKADLIPDKNYEKFYKFSHGEDLLRSIDLYKAASSVFFLQEGLYNYTINPESITMSVGPNNYEIDFTIRDMVNEYLEEENIFTAQDWDEYRGVCASLISQEIAMVSSFDISLHEKTKFYGQIAQSAFYRRSLSGKKFCRKARDEIVFRLFERKAYRILNLYGKLRKSYGNVLRHWISREYFRGEV